MNQKKCPKCGENNPVEAVMCWACYTPLSGAASGSGTATIGGSSAGAAAIGSEVEKKPVAMWQIGVIGVALLVMAGAAFMMFGGGGSTYDETGTATTLPDVTGSVVPPPPGGSVAPPSVPGAPAAQAARPSTSSVPAYTVTTAPNARLPVATVGMVPTRPVKPQEAAALAAGMRQRLRSGPWKSMYVYVFADQQSARQFDAHQSGRGGAPLAEADYQALSNVWPNTLARYENNGGSEGVRYPQSNPSGWWIGG